MAWDRFLVDLCRVEYTLWLFLSSSQITLSGAARSGFPDQMRLHLLLSPLFLEMRYASLSVSLSTLRVDFIL